MRLTLPALAAAIATPLALAACAETRPLPPQPATGLPLAPGYTPPPGVGVGGAPGVPNPPGSRGGDKGS